MPDRLAESFKALVRAVFPRVDYQAFYRYTVVSWSESAQTGDLQPYNLPDMPTLQRVPIRTPGFQYRLKAGTSVLVGYENADPGLPYIAFIDTATGEVPEMTHVRATQQVKIGPQPDLPAARQGDMVASGGNGCYATFFLTPGDTTPTPMTTMTPYLISFSASPPPYPPVPGLPPPLQGALYGFVSSGSPYVKE